MSKPARTFYTNELDSLVPRLKLRARGQTQPSRAELSYEMAKQRLRHGKKAKSIRKKARKNVAKIQKLLVDVKLAAPQPDWFVKSQEPIPTRSIISDILSLRDLRKDYNSMSSLPPPSRSNYGTAASSSIHTEHELYLERECNKDSNTTFGP